MINSIAEELIIIPLKKPFLDKITEQKKIVQGTIRPKSKPIQKTKNKKISEDNIKPKSKPIKNDEKIKTEIAEKVIEKIEISENKEIKKEKPEISLLTPKSKPLVVKKSRTINKTKSKFYSQKDFDIAKKSIQAMEKRNWTSAVSIAKKAKDKSIYNFIQWRHLLTKGNQASFFDYMVFIKQNENYPRINRIKYLAEHKLST